MWTLLYVIVSPDKYKFTESSPGYNYMVIVF